MIKLTILGTLLYPAYQYPMQSLLIAILLVFIADIVSQILNLKSEKEATLDRSYEEIKELFKEADDIMSKDIYLEDTPNWEVKCQPLDFTNYTYREVQSFCKSLNIPKVNRKRVVLEEELLALCN